MKLKWDIFFLSYGTFSSLLLVTFPLPRVRGTLCCIQHLYTFYFFKALEQQTTWWALLVGEGELYGLFIIIPIRSAYFPALRMPLEREKAYLDEMGPCC